MSVYCTSTSPLRRTDPRRCPTPHGVRGSAWVAGVLWSDPETPVDVGRSGPRLGVVCPPKVEEEVPQEV